MSILDGGIAPPPAKLEGKYAAMLVCWLLGCGSLLSWNCMVTIEDYYGYLFPQYHPSRVLTVVYQPFAVGTLAILAYNEAKLNTRKRNLFGYILFFIGSLIIIVLDLATSGKGGLGTFIGICAVTGLFGFADAFVQGGMIGDLSLMQTEFIQLPVVKYYRSKAALEGSRTVLDDLAAGGIQTLPQEQMEEDPKQQERLSNRELLKQNIDYAVDLFLIFVITLSIFPGFLSEDTGSHSLGTWYSLVLIAMFNVWDLIGRNIPLLQSLKLQSRKGLMVAVLFRFLLIPAFYYTAKYGDQGWMIMLTSFLGLTNGYLTVCVLTSAPKGYKGPEQNALGNLLVFFIFGGILSGAILDWLWLIGKGWGTRLMKLIDFLVL
ncbi:equilibrative nucleotide transporter 6 isoform X3 [Jatropha curcas]|uniref:equilibrative nucleotide transporter 6 isoform X3 n=1 Tax=Jatropha curcas TaxID=180498 RepID=UPI001895120C|nr:equilibrative nucleotide transporter 6 isoform X3 [Jatropha curcas]